MGTTESNSLLGYGKPPWIFKGSALYQLHLVKATTARAFIPKEFKLVEAFGYTLGGFFLANYDDSPAGTFDELVVIAGTVWNPPTSCAWAARVLVNSDKACVHGREEVGLPSEVASFSKRVAALPVRKKSQFHDFLHKFGTFDSSSGPKNGTDIHIKEMSNNTAMDICSINLISTSPQNDSKKWLCPAINISLPSFSGRTEYNPHLLKYSCRMECRVRVVPPVKVRVPSQSDVQGEASSDHGSSETDSSNYNRKLIISVMLSKPVLAFEFNSMRMKVQAPTIVQQ